MVVVVQGRNALCLPRYLRDNLPAFLYKDHVSRADLQRADEVLVVQRGALDDSAGEVHRLEVRHRRYHARAPHLISYLAQERLLLLGGELIGDSPARGLGSEAQLLLLHQTIHLQHDTVRSDRQVFAGVVPIGDICHHLVQRPTYADMLAYLKAPAASRLQAVEMGLGGQVFAQHII